MFSDQRFDGNQRKRTTTFKKKSNKETSAKHMRQKGGNSFFFPPVCWLSPLTTTECPSARTGHRGNKISCIKKGKPPRQSQAVTARRPRPARVPRTTARRRPPRRWSAHDRLLFLSPFYFVFLFLAARQSLFDFVVFIISSARRARPWALGGGGVSGRRPSGRAARRGGGREYRRVP